MESEVYRKILVPLDGSGLAEKALPYASDLAIRSGSEIVLINVRLPAENPYHPDLKEYLDEKAAVIERDIRAAAGKKVEASVKAVTISEGNFARRPAEGIVNFTQQNEIDLIIMASHGHSGIKHWALGGTSDKVLNISSIPVLLVRCDNCEPEPFNDILVPLDGSELAENVFPHVRKIVSSYQASRVNLLRVVGIPFFNSIRNADNRGNVVSEKELLEIERRERRAAEAYLSQAMDRIKLELPALHSEVMMGNAAETIVNYARENNIRLIVMSSHGHSGISRWTLGTIADRVLNQSELPVLLVRVPETAV